MLRDAVEWGTGVLLLFQDVMQNPETQSFKKYHNQHSSLPDGTHVTARKTEVLQQVEGLQDK
jgi:hypothetical protein